MIISGSCTNTKLLYYIQIVCDKVLSKVREFVGFVGLNSELKIIHRKVIWYWLSSTWYFSPVLEVWWYRTWM